jgi:hypothetical protein
MPRSWSDELLMQSILLTEREIFKLGSMGRSAGLGLQG